MYAFDVLIFHFSHACVNWICRTFDRLSHLSFLIYWRCAVLTGRSAMEAMYSSQERRSFAVWAIEQTWMAATFCRNLFQSFPSFLRSSVEDRCISRAWWAWWATRSYLQTLQQVWWDEKNKRWRRKKKSHLSFHLGHALHSIIEPDKRNYGSLFCPESIGANCLDINGTIVVPEAAPRTANLLRSLPGMKVITVDMSELAKVCLWYVIMVLIIHRLMEH